MEVTIVQNMPIPKATNGRAGSVSKYNSILDQMSVGDCVQFKKKGQQSYFRGLLSRKGIPVSYTHLTLPTILLV